MRRVLAVAAGAVTHLETCSEGRARLLLAGVLLLGAALRLAWAIAVPIDLTSDEVAFVANARSLFEHGVFGWGPDRPTAVRPPGTAAFFAGLMALGLSLEGIALVHVALGTATVWLLHALVRESLGQATALLAALGLAVWPSFAIYAPVMASETLFLFLMMAMLVLWVRLGRTGWPGVVAFTAVFVAAVYVRPAIALLPAGLAFVALLRGRLGWRAAAMRLLVAYAVLFAAVAPWSQRNVEVMGGFSAISTNFGPILLMGNWPGTPGTHNRIPERYLAGSEGLGEIARGRLLGARAVDLILAEPGRFVLRTAKKAVLFHQRQSVAIHLNAPGAEAVLGRAGERAVWALGNAAWFAGLAAAAVGLGFLLLAAPPAARDFPGMWVWLYFVGVHSVLIVNDRFNLQVTPFVIALAAYGAVRLAGRMARAP